MKRTWHGFLALLTLAALSGCGGAKTPDQSTAQPGTPPAAEKPHVATVDIPFKIY